MRMDVSLQGLAGTVSNRKKKGKNVARDNNDVVDQVGKFLDDWEAARIVVILKTHCLENGRFVWKGDKPENYTACSLKEVQSVLSCECNS